MCHCTPDELMDVADGVCAAEAVPHLADCAECRAQVDELRRLTTDVAAVPVPEPPPQFWAQLSERVHDAVAREPLPQRSRFEWLRVSAWSDRRAVWPAVVTLAAAVILAVVFVPRQLVTRPSDGREGGPATTGLTAGRAAGGDGSAGSGAVEAGSLSAAGEPGGSTVADVRASEAPATDASFMAFMGDIADGIDLDAAASAGLAPTGAVTDAAVSDLNGDEQVELLRLIKEALAGSGV